MTVKDWLDRAHLGDVAVITKSYGEIYLTRSTSGAWIQYYYSRTGREQELSSVLSSWGKVEVGDYIISHKQDDTMTCEYCESVSKLQAWAHEELIKLDKEPISCSCPLLTIMQTGCTCGGV